MKHDELKSLDVRFLNKDVEKEVIRDPMLYVLWCAKMGTYDWEIDPLHNPDWCNTRRKQEISKLLELRAFMNKTKAEYELNKQRLTND